MPPTCSIRARLPFLTTFAPAPAARSTSPEPSSGVCTRRCLHTLPHRLSPHAGTPRHARPLANPPPHHTVLRIRCSRRSDAARRHSHRGRAKRGDRRTATPPHAHNGVLTATTAGTQHPSLPPLSWPRSGRPGQKQNPQHPPPPCNASRRRNLPPHNPRNAVPHDGRHGDLSPHSGYQHARPVGSDRLPNSLHAFRATAPGRVPRSSA